MKRVTKQRLNWEIFLMEVDDVPPPPSVPLALRLYAAGCTIRGLRILQKEGWGAACRYLQALRPGQGASANTALAPAIAIRLGWRNVLLSQLILRFLAPNALCLARSYALTVYLSALGLPAVVAIAREKLTVNPRYNFHAWSELYGTVLNDSPEVPNGYTVLQRLACRHLEQDSDKVIA
jgi:hypothetical protein